MNRRILFLIPLLLFTFSLISKETVYILTIPKSGTHCIEKYFTLLDYIDVKLPVKLKRSHISEVELGLPHGYLEQPNIKKILLIRDLRDVFISQAHHISKYWHWLQSIVIFDVRWKDLTLEQQLLEMIDYENEPQDFHWHYKDRTMPQQIKKTVQKAIRFTHLPNTLVVRFEDLSGGHGKDAQQETIRRINTFLGVTLNQEQLGFVSDNLFGNNLLPGKLFRKGESYQWKSQLSPALCEKIKYLYGQDLIDLGYEKDLHWRSGLQ